MDRPRKPASFFLVFCLLVFLIACQAAAGQTSAAIQSGVGQSPRGSVEPQGLSPTPTLRLTSTPTASPTAFTIPPWPTGEPEEQGLDSGLLADMVSDIRSNGSKMHSILIARHGVLVFEVYFDPFYNGAPHQLASCTKSITSALVGIAIGKGLIQGMDQPVYGFFPDLALDDEAKKAITLEHLLTMSSGLDWAEGGNDYRSPVNDFTAINYESNPAQYFFDHPLAQKPGSTFVYNSGGSNLLSLIVSKTSAMDTLDFARQELFGPLDIKQVNWEKTETGARQGGAGLQLLPRDMAKFGELYLQHGRWLDRQIVPAEWVGQSSIARMAVTNGIQYGYQWWIPDGEGFTASGWGNQNIWVLPEQDMVVVFTAGTKNDKVLANKDYLDRYILPAVQSDKALPDDPEKFDLLQAEIQKAQHPTPQAVKDIPGGVKELIGKTYLITDSNITLGLQTITIQKIEADQMTMQIGLTGEDADLLVGLDGVYRRARTKNGEIALKGYWEDERTLVFDWQALDAAESARLHIRYEGQKIRVKVDLWIEGFSEESEGEILDID